MKRIAVLVLVIALGICYPTVAAEVSEDSIIRIHVLAHNDTNAEQQLKLKVRDAVLQYVAPLISEAKDGQAAALIIEQNLLGITQAADECLAELGSTHSASTQWGKFVFPTRVYGQSALPAGRYTALNIHIGEGKGKNWWCVMYPPLCYVDGVVAKGQQVEYQFALLNWLRSLWGRISQ